MTPCGSWMPRALAIAARARCRAQCQESSTTIKPRRVSAVVWPLASSLSASSPTPSETSQPLPLAPVVWKDWPRCRIRRAWLKLLRSETVGLTSSARPSPSPVIPAAEEILTRAQRAHWRLRWRAAVGSQCTSVRCSSSYDHAPWSARHLCPLLRLRSPRHCVSNGHEPCCFARLRLTKINTVAQGAGGPTSSPAGRAGGNE
jgi:hypothetical protein